MVARRKPGSAIGSLSTTSRRLHQARGYRAPTAVGRDGATPIERLWRLDQQTDFRPSGYINRKCLVRFRYFDRGFESVGLYPLAATSDPAAGGYFGGLTIALNEPRRDLLEWPIVRQAAPEMGAFQKDETQLSRNIALIGCGAISQVLYIPALANARRDFGRVWIVDPRARVLGAAALAALGTAEIVTSLEQVTDEIALAIIAAPNGLHFHLAREALKRGAHVLIEKPFVVRPSDGADLLEIAATQDRLVVVNQTRRFFPLANEIRRRIKKGDFGAFKSASHFEGTKLAWPFESGAAFAKDAYRTGVIMDFGVHVLDFYHFLLAPKWDLVSAIHDGIQWTRGTSQRFA